VLIFAPAGGGRWWRPSCAGGRGAAVVDPFRRRPLIGGGVAGAAGGYDPAGTGFQLVEAHAWVRSLGIEYRLGVDGISVLLILLTTGLAPLCVLASWKYIGVRVKEFMVCLLVMETAMVGVFCALDFVLFFVFWEAMLIPMSLMIGVWGGPRRVYAALKFFVYTMAGSALMLAAIVALRLKVGSFGIPEMMGRNLSPEFQCWVFGRSCCRSRSRFRWCRSTPGCRRRTWRRRRRAA
jgi:NADH:ubiquinone oxidoreductase subunit 4 (subunit M)